MSTIIEEPVGDAKPNLAPTESLVKAAKGAKPDSTTLAKYLKKRFSSLSKEREDTWREIYAAAHLLALFARGKQQVRRATYSHGWRPYGDLRDTGVDDIRAINLFRFYLDNIVVKWVQSAADLVVRAAKDTDDAILSAEAGNVIIEHYENKLYTPEFKQREARLAAITGMFVRRYYYEYDGSSTARRQIFDSVPFGGGSVGYCADCGAMDQTGAMSEGVCPDCGSPNVTTEEAQPVEAQSFQQTEEYRSGTICCQTVPLWNLRYDLSERFCDSPYLIYSRRIRKDVLLGQLEGRIRVPGGKTQDAGLDAAQALAYNGPAIGGKNLSGIINRADEDDAQFCDLHEMWLEPSMYGHVILKTDVETVAGQVIPAGPLQQSFPNGLCVMGINQMETPLYLYDECKNDHWLAKQYHMDVISGVGDGMVDCIEIQRQMNITNSQIFEQIRSQATPAILYDKDLISGDDAAYLGSPRQNIPVNLNRLPEQRTLQQAVYQMMPGQIPGHVLEYGHQYLNNMFQLTAHTTDFSGGLPGVNNSTATGAQIGAALAQSLHAPQLQMLAEMNKEGAELMLRLFQKYCKDEHYLKMAGKTGAEQGIWLKAADIDTDLTIEIIPESWLPQNGFERRQRLQEFITFFGNVEGLQQALTTNPKLVGRLLELSDIDLHIGDWNSVMRLGRKRIEQMKKVLPAAEQMAMTVDDSIIQSAQAMGADPAVLFGNMLLHAVQPRPDIREDAHDVAASYYCNWLTTDEGLAASPILRSAVMSLADAHNRFQAQGGPMAPAAMPMPMMPEMGGGGFPEMPVGGGQSPAMASANANLKAPAPGAMQ